MAYPHKSKETIDVHAHTTLSPATFKKLSKYSKYEKFVRVRARQAPLCGAEMVNSAGVVQRVIEENSYDATVRRHDCKKHGVTMEIISPTSMQIPDYVDNATDATGICEILNNDNAAFRYGKGLVAPVIASFYL